MDAINKLLTSDTMAIQSIQKDKPLKKNENALVIPIKVDFLFVKEGGKPLAEARMNFEKLPFNNGHEDINTEFAYVSENFLSKPFQNANLVLPPGLHIHWAIPDSFTKGKTEGNENQKQVVHYKVPDRWIINRKKGNVVERSWIVESNYLHQEGKENKYGSIAYPLKVISTGQSFRYMGRSYLFYTKESSVNISDKINEAEKSQYLSNLTIAGYGEHSFAAFYPNCHSVFGFCDKEIKDFKELTAFEYEILGWYSDPYSDPLNERCNALNFDGVDDHIILPSTTEISVNAFTIEAFIYPTTTVDGLFRLIIGYPALYIYNGRCLGGGFIDGGRWYSFTSEPVITLNAWNHIAMSYDGISLCVYVNGSKVYATNDFAGKISNNQSVTVIGKSNGEAYYFGGHMKDVRIWNKCRTQDEIRSGMNYEFDANEPGLVAYYKFNQGFAGTDNAGISKLFDSSKNQNHADLIGFNLKGSTSNWIKDTADNKTVLTALKFNGVNDFIIVPDNDDIRLVPYTAELWIKPNEQPNEEWKGLLGKPGRNFNIWLHNSGLIHHRFCININNVEHFNEGPPSTPAGSIKWNEWNHVAITNNGSTAITYINGKQQASCPVNGTLVPKNTPLLIGCNLDNKGGNYFNGEISEVRVWNVARTAEQIQSSMNIEFNKPQTNLVAYYKPGADQVSTGSKGVIMLNDSSGNGHAAMLNSSPNFTETPPAIRLGRKLKAKFNFKLNTVSNSIAQLPLKTLCYATLDFINANNSVPLQPASVAVGNNSTEALAAWLSKKLQFTSTGDGEDELNALSQIASIANKKLDIDALLEEEFHEKGFSPVSGGHIWRLYIESTINKTGSGKNDGIDITLPESFAFSVNDLNRIQQIEDKLKDELRSLRHQLYVDWCKYMAASYHPDIEKGLPQSDDIRYFIETYSQKEIGNKIKNIGENNKTLNRLLQKLYSVVAKFNTSNKYENVVLNPDGSLNETESKAAFAKLITSLRYDPSFHQQGIHADAALDNVYVKKF